MVWKCFAVLHKPFVLLDESFDWENIHKALQLIKNEEKLRFTISLVKKR